MDRIKEYYTFDENGLKRVDENDYIEYTENAFIKIVCYTKTKRFVAYIASKETYVVNDISDILNDIFLDCMFATGNEHVIRYRLSVY